MRIDQWLSNHFQKDDYVAITGTTSGIGREYALAFAKLGCNLICVSNEEQALETQKEEMERDYKIKGTNFCVDLRDVEQTRKAAQEIAKMPISVLVNNAGFGLKGPFQKNPVDSYIDVITVNAIGPVVFTHAVLPHMQKKGVGLIIHVASINALVPIPNNQVYTATKAFCYSYASAVSRENKDSGICFQIVLPGTTKTPFHERQGAHPTASAMTPDQVVRASFKNVSKAVCIPNPMDRILAKLGPFLPRNFAMDLASYLLKRRLGV